MTRPFCLAFAIACVSVGCLDIHFDVGAKKKVSTTLNLQLDGDGVTALNASASNGSITVLGQEGTSISVVAVKEVRARSLAEAESFANQVSVRSR